MDIVSRERLGERLSIALFCLSLTRVVAKHRSLQYLIDGKQLRLKPLGGK